MSFFTAFSGTLTIDNTVIGTITSNNYNGASTVLELEQNRIRGLDEDLCKQYGSGMYSFSADLVNLEWNGAFKQGSYGNDFVYCKTTTDLINFGAIPRTWVNDNLILYCNEGREIFNSNENPDLDIISNLNVYKACIVKNLDLVEHNTIIFGLYSGNPIKNPSPYTNKDNVPLFINALTKVTQKGISLDTKYHTDSSFFYMSTFTETDFYPLNYVFQVNKYGVEESRVFIAKSFNGEKVAYGFDDSSDFTIKLSTNDAGELQGLCQLTLSRYSNQLDCGSNYISISRADDITSFNLVKNIIFELEHSQGTSQDVSSNQISSNCLSLGGTPYYENGDFVCRYSKSSCPSGSTVYTSTQGNFGIDEKPAPEGWEDRMLQGACFTGLHSFSKTTSVESCDAVSYGEQCWYTKKSLGLKKECGKVQTSTKYDAQIVEVGCR